MDLASFSENDFEPVKWINESFENNKNINKEKFASDVVIKLQSFIHEINKSLEDFSKNIIINSNKVNKEIVLIKNEAFKSKNVLDQIQCEINRIQIENNAPFMEKLIEINLIKNRMQDTCNSLKEADNWINLSKELEILFDSSDIDSIASKLILMQKRLELLTDIPDYVDRIVKLNSYKKKFEILFLPKLSLIINSIIQKNQTNYSNENKILVAKYIDYFKQLEKLDSLKQVYYDAFCHQMTLEWQKIKDFDIKENILDWLSNYIDYLISIWNDQNKSLISLIIDNPVLNFLIDLLIDLFNKLNDDFTKLILDYFESKNDVQNRNYCINFVVSVKNTLDRLTKNIDSLIENDKSNEIKINQQLTKLLVLIYYPYKKLLQNYLKFEIKLAENEFLYLTNSNHQLNEFVIKIFQNLRESEKRIHSLSKSVLIPKFVNFINQHFSNCLDYLNKLILDLENQINCKKTNLINPDWNLFQKAIYYLQIIGEFNLKFECFQQQLFNSLLDLKINLSKSNQISQKYHLLFLDETDQFNFSKTDFSNPDLLFKSNKKKLAQLCHKSSSLIFVISMNYIENYLDQMKICFNNSIQSTQENFSDQDQLKENELLKLSLTPNEYITQIGQYLLTLPQHIEPFINQENISLKSAFKYFNLTQQNKTNQHLELKNLAEFFLNSLIHQIVQQIVKRIKQFNFQNNQNKLQLVTDIEYINEVIEDLGFTSNKYLDEILSKFLIK